MADPVARPAPDRFSRTFHWAGYALGFGVGGFFDGILLHQILQWHHLLSGLQGAPYDDLRFQVLADGLFHVFMYVVTVVGLWLLWRSRREFAAPGADRLLLANAMIGFGVWHIVDAVLSHWTLQIHRIRMDSEVPLLWDLAWAAIFGVVFIIVGWLIRSRGGARGEGRYAAPAAVVLLALTGAAGSALPPRDQSMAVVVFRPGITPAEAFVAMSSVGGRLVWSDASDQVWAIDLPEDARTFELYRRGALMVSNSFLPVGCLNWFEVPASEVTS